MSLFLASHAKIGPFLLPQLVLILLLLVEERYYNGIREKGLDDRNLRRLVA